MSSIFSQSLKSKFTEEFINDVASNNSNYYVCFGRASPWDDDQNPPQANAAVSSYYYDVQQNILFGKKVDPTDIAYMARNIQWTSNTIFDYYDDKDPNLYSKNYYVINQYGRVYKCLFNNYGAASLVVPNITSTIGDFTTSDGYIWKYLYSVTSSYSKKFSTSNYFPANTDVSVKSHAEPGAIHLVVVDSSANGYLHTTDFVQSLLTTTLVQISNTASSLSGAYTNSTFYISNGTGAGTLRIISDYVVNTSGKFVSTFDQINSLDSTSQYLICPYVNIIGNGTGAEAIAYVNNYTTQIDSIQIVNRGLGYSYASVTIEANSIFVTGDTIAHTTIAPPGGHGSNPIKELGCDTTGLSVLIANSDNFPSWITYRQLSLVYNPIASTNNDIFTNVSFENFYIINISNIQQPFQPGEIITGFLSGATATVLNCTPTQMQLIDVVGTFSNYEVVTGTFSGLTGTISVIIPPELVINTGEVFYYRNFEPVTRDPLSSEQIKLFFKV